MTAPVPWRPWRWYAGWLLTFLGFPLGGLPAIALGGIDDAATALLGGAAAGVVIGAAQALALRRLPIADGLSRVRWTLLSGAGSALGLAVGAAVVDYGTSGTDLVVQGLLGGAGIGVGQGLAARPWSGDRFAAAWAGAVTLLWPVGWTVTRLAGVSVEDQFAVFGATGALAVTALLGLVALGLLARPGQRPTALDPQPPLGPDRPAGRSRWPTRVLAVVGVAAILGLATAAVVDLRGFDRTSGGYEAPYTGWTGTPIDWNDADVTDEGFRGPGRVLDFLLDCTTGMISVESFGFEVDFRVVSERAIVVHRPREACRSAGFEPQF